ncbi:MAG: transposase [Bacteroidetes bacterium]|nr:transposase [Bacteroidota bacterium]
MARSISSSAQREIERASYRIAPSSPMGKAIRYFHDQWPGMEEFLKDGRYDRDNNLIEDEIRLSVCSSGSLSKNNRITDNLL